MMMFEIDDDAEIVKLKNEIDDFNEQIQKLQDARIRNVNAIHEIVDNVVDWGNAQIKKYIDCTGKDSNFLMRVTSQDNSTRRLYRDSWLYAERVHEDGLMVILLNNTPMGYYATVKNFKVAIEEFVAAIERKDKNFKFPEDS